MEALDTRRYDFGAAVQSLVQGKYVLTARLAASSQHHSHVYGEILERDRHDMLFGEVSARGTSGRHTWVLGAAVERDGYCPQDVPRFGYMYLTPGVFAQDDVTITPWLSVSASARVDFHNRYDTFFSPRLATLFSLATVDEPNFCRAGILCSDTAYGRDGSGRSYSPFHSRSASTGKRAKCLRRPHSPLWPGILYGDILRLTDYKPALCRAGNAVSACESFRAHDKHRNRASCHVQKGTVHDNGKLYVRSFARTLSGDARRCTL